MTSPLLSVSGLSKSFATARGRVRAVQDLSFDIRSGETLAIVGESGSGKTTAALATLLLTPPDRGRIRFAGQDIAGLRAAGLRPLRRRLSIVQQSPYASLNPRMRVWAIVAEAARLAALEPEVSAKVAAVLDSVGFPPGLVSRYPHELSGGQLQRVAIARVLALEPEMIVLDEPTAALDVSVQAQVMNLLKSLRNSRGVSYLLISHNLPTVQFLADRILVMYLGRAVESGPARDVLERPCHPYTRMLVGSVPGLRTGQRGRVPVARGEAVVPTAPIGGCAFAPRCDRASPRCLREVPDLAPDRPGSAVACHYPHDETAPVGRPVLQS